MSFLESAFKFKLKMNKKKFSILKPCIRLATMLVLECFIISCIAPNYCSKSYNVLFSSKICNLNSTLNRTSDCLAPPLKTNKLARDEVRDFVLAATKNAEDLYTSMRRNVNPDREFQVYLTKYVKESLKFPEFQPIAQEVRNKLLELDDRDRLVDAANRALATIPEGIRDITADISLEDVVSVFGNALTITIAFELAVEREGPDYFILHKDEIVEGLFNVIVLAKAWREVHEAEKIKKALKEWINFGLGRPATTPLDWRSIEQFHRRFVKSRQEQNMLVAKLWSLLKDNLAHVEPKILLEELSDVQPNPEVSQAPVVLAIAVPNTIVSMFNISDEKNLHIDGVDIISAGKVIGASQTLVGLGHRVHLVNLVGNGAVGERFENIIRRVGFESLVSVEMAEDTRFWPAIIRKEDAAEWRFSSPGPSISPEESSALDLAIDDLYEGAEPGTIVIMGGNIPQGAYIDFWVDKVKHAKSHELMVFFDNLDKEIPSEGLEEIILAGVDLIKPNINEFSNLIGKDVESIEDDPEVIVGEARQFIRSINASGGNLKVIIVSRGEKDPIIVKLNEAYLASIPSVTVRGTVGSGDALIGALAHKLSIKEPLKEAFRFAVAVATVSTQKSGAMRVATMEEAEAMVSRVKVKQIDEAPITEAKKALSWFTPIGIEEWPFLIGGGIEHDEIMEWLYDCTREGKLPIGDKALPLLLIDAHHDAYEGWNLITVGDDGQVFWALPNIHDTNYIKLPSNEEEAREFFRAYNKELIDKWVPLAAKFWQFVSRPTFLFPSWARRRKEHELVGFEGRVYDNPKRLPYFNQPVVLSIDLDYFALKRTSRSTQTHYPTITEINKAARSLVDNLIKKEIEVAALHIVPITGENSWVAEGEGAFIIQALQKEFSRYAKWLIERKGQYAVAQSQLAPSKLQQAKSLITLMKLPKLREFSKRLKEYNIELYENWQRVDLPRINEALSRDIPLWKKVLKIADKLEGIREQFRFYTYLPALLKELDYNIDLFNRILDIAQDKNIDELFNFLFLDVMLASKETNRNPERLLSVLKDETLQFGGFMATSKEGHTEPINLIDDEKIKAWEYVEQDAIFSGERYAHRDVYERIDNLLGQLEQESKLGNLILDLGAAEYRPHALRHYHDRDNIVIAIGAGFKGESEFIDNVDATTLAVKADAYDLDSALQRPDVYSFMARAYGNKEASFDSAVLFDLLNYIDYQHVIKDVLRYIKPGGRLIISNMAGAGLDKLFDEKGVKSNAELLRFLEELGLEIEIQEVPDEDYATDTYTTQRQIIVARKKSRPAGDEELRRQIAAVQAEMEVYKKRIKKIWPDDSTQTVTKRINEKIIPTIFGGHFLFVGKFLFVSEEEWEKKRNELENFEGSVIICNLYPDDVIEQYLNFTDGYHTLLSIQLMLAYEDEIRGRVVLDAGSGKDAILGMVAHKMGAKAVICVEREEMRVHESIEFLKMNGIAEDDVRILHSDIVQLTEMNERVDVVIANLPVNGFYKSDGNIIIKFEELDEIDNFHRLLAAKFSPDIYFLCGMPKDESWFDKVRKLMREVGYEVITEASEKPLSITMSEAFVLQKGMQAPRSFAEPPEKAIDIYKPFSEMEFEELIWWYKAFLVNKLINFAELNEQIIEIENLLRQRGISIQDDIDTDSFYMWAKRICAKEFFLSIGAYKQIYGKEPFILTDLSKLKEEMEQKISSCKSYEEGIAIYKNYIIMVMALIDELNKPREDLNGKTLFEKIYEDRVSDSEWHAEVLSISSLLWTGNYSPGVLFKTPSLLTKDDVNTTN